MSYLMVVWQTGNDQSVYKSVVHNTKTRVYKNH